MVPKDPEALKIKCLDSGKEYTVGDGEPVFEYATWGLGENGVESDEGNVGTVPQSRSEGYFTRFYRWFFNKQIPGQSANSKITESRPKSKSPFSKLDSFKFRRRLGEGAFGKVLLAESIADGRLYAMKIMEKKGMRTSDRRQAQAERDILLAMSRNNPHPFTTGLKFAFQSEKRLYLGMDFLPGGTLKALIQKFGCLPEAWVRFYCAELILAISHLHSLDVLYRDIKPHNVMLDGRGHIMLIDYGLSKREVRDPKGAVSLVGTPDYSAPEVLKTGAIRLSQRKSVADASPGGKGAPDKRSDKALRSIGYGKAADWWSLGVMMYEMLHGRPPFRGGDLRETYKNVLFGELKFPNEPHKKMNKAALAQHCEDPIILLRSVPQYENKGGTSGEDEGVEGKAEGSHASGSPVMRTSENKGHFSSASYKALSSFLSRDPLNRLGSTASTDSLSVKTHLKECEQKFEGDVFKGLAAVPYDIITCDFFEPFCLSDWAGIFRRVIDGPWLPEPDPILLRKGFTGYDPSPETPSRTKGPGQNENESAEPTGTLVDGVDGTPATSTKGRYEEQGQMPSDYGGFEYNGTPRTEAALNKVGTTSPVPPPPSSDHLKSRAPVPPDGDRFDQKDSNSSLPLESEFLSIQDSIIGGPARQGSMVQDWSFVDESALIMAATGGVASGNSAGLPVVFPKGRNPGV